MFPLLNISLYQKLLWEVVSYSYINNAVCHSLWSLGLPHKAGWVNHQHGHTRSEEKYRMPGCAHL